MALLSGDPYKAAPLTVLLSMPDGYKMPPHFHLTDEHVEVKQGTFLVGMGDKFDLKKTQPMAVGDTATARAGSAAPRAGRPDREAGARRLCACASCSDPQVRGWGSTQVAFINMEVPNGWRVTAAMAVMNHANIRLALALQKDTE
jgi:hypothetical protein